MCELRPIIAKVEETAKAETTNNAKRAEQEWQRATRGYTGKTFSAAPSINLRTLEDGVEVTVQYISTAIGPETACRSAGVARARTLPTA